MDDIHLLSPSSYMEIKCLHLVSTSPVWPYLWCLLYDSTCDIFCMTLSVTSPVWPYLCIIQVSQVLSRWLHRLPAFTWHFQIQVCMWVTSGWAGAGDWEMPVVAGCEVSGHSQVSSKDTLWTNEWLTLLLLSLCSVSRGLALRRHTAVNLQCKYLQSLRKIETPHSFIKMNKEGTAPLS